MTLPSRILSYSEIVEDERNSKIKKHAGNTLFRQNKTHDNKRFMPPDSA